MNPFDWEGPAFLALYLVVLPTAIVVAIALRWMLRLPADEPPAEANDLSPYEIAYLAGRERLAVDNAIVRLMRRGALAVDAATGKLSQRGELPAEALELEKVVFFAAGREPGKHINEVHTAAASVAGKPREQLEGFGLLVNDNDATVIRLAAAGVVFLAFLFGLVKVFVGVSRERPVGFLIALLVVTAIAAAAVSKSTALRSSAGTGLPARRNSAATWIASGRASAASEAVWASRSSAAATKRCRSRSVRLRSSWTIRQLTWARGTSSLANGFSPTSTMW